MTLRRRLIAWRSCPPARSRVGVELQEESRVCGHGSIRGRCKGNSLARALDGSGHSFGQRGSVVFLQYRTVHECSLG
ncbi:hypothetical protein MRB53_038012 [Persea americana]|nr:hypothetical protein MRB53_038012 [Persea americana]